MSNSDLPPIFLPKFVAGRFIINDTMMQDLRTIAALSEDVVGRIREDVENAEGFLGRERLQEILGQHLQEDAQTSSLTRILLNVEPDDLEPLLSKIREWSQDKQNAPTTLTQDEMEAILTHLPSLVVSYPSLDRNRKAIRVSQALGQPLQAVEIICELRPVFDPSRERLEGMIPCTRLKLVSQNENGDSVSTEVQLTPEQVHELNIKTEQALKKLEVLSGYIIENASPYGVPEIPGYRILSEEHPH